MEEEPAETVQPVEEDPVPAVFTWPVKGEILSGFSLEVLAYDETMGDWRTHSGVDIAASVDVYKRQASFTCWPLLAWPFSLLNFALFPY